MKKSSRFEFPATLSRQVKKAKNIQIITIVYLLSSVVAIFFVMGNSQAMKTALADDALSLIPPAVFLLAVKYSIKTPDERFPYGYHRVVSIAFLGAALALFSMGLLLLLSAILTFVRMDYPTIGSIFIFGRQIWLGWLMIAALLWSGIFPFFLGKAKQPIASDLHDKVLYADAVMDKANSLTAAAAIVGIIGIGMGLWWADGAIAAVISLDILRDGFTNTREVFTNLMDEKPKTTDHKGYDPLTARLEKYIRSLHWVKDVRVRLRENGHVFFGDIFVVPRSEEDLLSKLEEARTEAKRINWRLHEIIFFPVKTFDEESG